MFFFHRPIYNVRGGRRCDELMGLVEEAKLFTHVFVIVGVNDAKYESIFYICRKFKEFSQAIWPTQVKFAGHMRRKDLPAALVAKNNMILRNQLGFQLKSTRIIRRDDFDDNHQFHFNRFGEGYRHMGALILSVLREFSDNIC